MKAQGENIDLGPLYEPSPVGFHFETLGWYILFSILTILVILFLIKAGLKYHKNSYRRQATQLVSTIEARFLSTPEAACINELMVVLKQVSLTTYTRADVANLSGQSWLEFLESKSTGLSFVQYKDLLQKALYQDEVEHIEEIKQLFLSSKKWINHHT